MWTGIQWTGTLGPNASNSWYTWGWPVASRIVWYMIPTSPQAGAPQLDWTIAVERANTTQCTYWITVKNLTSNPLTFEGRYAVLA